MSAVEKVLRPRERETNKTPDVLSRQTNFVIVSSPGGVYEFISETDRYEGG